MKVPIRCRCFKIRLVPDARHIVREVHIVREQWLAGGGVEPETTQSFEPAKQPSQTGFFSVSCSASRSSTISSRKCGLRSFVCDSSSGTSGISVLRSGQVDGRVGQADGRATSPQGRGQQQDGKAEAQSGPRDSTASESYWSGPETSPGQRASESRGVHGAGSYRSSRNSSGR